MKARIWDYEVWARTVWGEARGETPTTIVAVAKSIWNRCMLDGRRYGATPAAVCLRDKQYSSWNHGDPNRDKMIAVDETDDVFNKIYHMLINLNAMGDPTKGATHYYDDSIKAPAWTKNATFTGKFGRLNFYKDVP